MFHEVGRERFQGLDMSLQATLGWHGWCGISCTGVDEVMSNDVWLRWPLMLKYVLCSRGFIFERVGMLC